MSDRAHRSESLRRLRPALALAALALLASACPPTTGNPGTTTTIPIGPSPAASVSWTHAPAVDQVVDGDGIIQHRARTKLDFDGSYYPVGAVLPSAIEWDPGVRNSGRILGGQLGDLQTLSVPLMDQVPLTAAIESLSPAERAEIGAESLVSAGLAGTTWSTALGGDIPDTERSWAEVLSAADSNSPGLQGIFLSKLSVEDSPMRRVELGAIVLRDAKLGDLPLHGETNRSAAFIGWCNHIDCSGLDAESTVNDVHLRGIPMRRVPVEQIPMRRVNPAQVGELMSVPMRRVDPNRAAGLASIPMRRVDLAKTGIAGIPMRRVDLTVSGIASIPMRRVDLGASPIGAILVSSLASPAAVVTCSPSCNGQTLAQVAAAGQLRQTATLGNLASNFATNDALTLGTLFPFLTGEFGGVDPTIGDFILGLPSDAFGNSFTVGDIVGGLPTDDLPSDGAFDQRATLGDLLEGVLQVEGTVGVSPELDLSDSVAVRLDVGATFVATRSESVRATLALPDGARTEVESAEQFGLFSAGGTGCAASGLPLEPASAIGEFDVELIEGCQYRLSARVALPVRYPDVTLGLRLTKVGGPGVWTVAGPAVRIGHGPDRVPPSVACATSTYPGTGTNQVWKNEFFDCAEPSADSWFTDPPDAVVSAAYLDFANVNEYISLPRSNQANLYVRRLDGKDLRVTVFDPPAASSAGIPRVTIARDTVRPASPTWFNPPDSKDNRVFDVQVGSDWISLGGTRRSSANSRAAISSSEPGWYAIVRTVADEYPNSAIVASGKPALTDQYWSSSNAKCADFTSVSRPLTATQIAQHTGIGLLFNYGGTWAQYGRTRTLNLWNEIVAWETAGLGKVHLGNSGSTCSDFATGKLIAESGAGFGSSTIALGGYDLVGALADPGGAGGVGRADAEDSLTIGREATYGPIAARTRAALPAAASDLLATNSSVTGAARDEFLLHSDNPAKNATARLVDPYDNLIGYVGDHETGRLVETPEEITAQLRAYRLSATKQISNTNSLVAGYDFLSDSSSKVATLLQGVAPTVDSSLIRPEGSPAWTATDLRTKLTQLPKESISVINAHFDHTAVLSEAGSTNDTNDLLTTQALVSAAGTSMAQSLVVTIGCHSGLPVPDYLYPAGSDKALDWPQAMARLGVPVFVASVGYGYGDTDLTAYSERLEQLFVQQLGYQETVGEALTMAKRLYIAERPSISGYDAKVVMSFTLFGIPTWKTPGVHPKPAFTDLPATLSATSATAGVAAPVTGPSTDVLARSFTFTPKFGADPAGPSQIKLNTSAGGTYVGGFDGDVYVFPGQATLPSGSVALSDVAGKVPVGVLLDSVNGTVLTGASRALISRPVLGGDAAEVSTSQSKSPRRAWDLSRSLTADRLNLVTGRYNAVEGQSTGTYSVFTNMTGRVLYSSPPEPSSSDPARKSPDRTPPQTTVSAATNGSAPGVTVDAVDASGIWLVRLTYRTSSGTWTSIDATPGGTNTASVRLNGPTAAASGSLDAFVQVVDMVGNVTMTNV